MKNFKLMACVALLVSCQTPSKPLGDNASTAVVKPKNIIFMVGDGMGIAQITAGMLANGNKLALEKAKVVGMIKTQSGDNLITDSAAGATAFSTGKKSYNRAIGVDMDTVAHETILEAAAKEELATGIVVTASLTHATPACYYAHQPNRYMMEEIALDFSRNPVDFFIGGGRKYFADRKDKKNLIDSLTARGFKLVNNLELTKGDESKVGFFTADEEPESILRGREAYLPKGVKAAVKRLSKNENGFFLLVEGSQIDWGGHQKDSDYIIDEMLEFDDAIGEALAFAEQDGNTLVVITADHETGGYAITGGTLDGKILETAFVNDKHSAEMVPVFAFGPGAEAFSGIYENTSIYDKMMDALQLKKPAI